MSVVALLVALWRRHCTVVVLIVVMVAAATLLASNIEVEQTIGGSSVQSPVSFTSLNPRSILCPRKSFSFQSPIAIIMDVHTLKRWRCSLA